MTLMPFDYVLKNTVLFELHYGILGAYLEIPHELAKWIQDTLREAMTDPNRKSSLWGAQKAFLKRMDKRENEK